MSFCKGHGLDQGSQEGTHLSLAVFGSMYGTFQVSLNFPSIFSIISSSPAFAWTQGSLACSNALLWASITSALLNVPSWLPSEPAPHFDPLTSLLLEALSPFLPSHCSHVLLKCFLTPFWSSWPFLSLSSPSMHSTKFRSNYLQKPLICTGHKYLHSISIVISIISH